MIVAGTLSALLHSCAAAVVYRDSWQFRNGQKRVQLLPVLEAESDLKNAESIAVRHETNGHVCAEPLRNPLSPGILAVYVQRRSRFGARESGPQISVPDESRTGHTQNH